jgi:hypothetical protein
MNSDHSEEVMVVVGVVLGAPVVVLTPGLVFLVVNELYLVPVNKHKAVYGVIHFTLRMQSIPFNIL